MKKSLSLDEGAEPVDMRVPPKVLRGGISKSILKRPCQFLAINAHKMAPRTNQWIQERTWDTPTYGLLWTDMLRHVAAHPTPP